MSYHFLIKIFNQKIRILSKSIPQPTERCPVTGTVFVKKTVRFRKHTGPCRHTAGACAKTESADDGGIDGQLLADTDDIGVLDAVPTLDLGHGHAEADRDAGQNVAAGEFYGMERLEAALNRTADGDPKAILQAVQADVDAFTAQAKQFDDLTMLCLEYRGGGASRPE